jgi:hypothetical protein
VCFGPPAYLLESEEVHVGAPHDLFQAGGESARDEHVEAGVCIGQLGVGDLW